MSRNLLFISKYPDIVKEFLEAMKEKEIEIDTALNGSEVAACLKKKNYQVVVTGLALDGATGAQIITYLNNKCPDTVCIIYTTNISPAELHFLINERSVFRVFLRPVDFRGEFFLALKEAYEHYDVCARNREEAGETAEELEQKRQECVVFERRLKVQGGAKESARRYMKRLAALSLMEYGEGLTEEQKAQAKKLEWEMADLCCATEEQMPESLTRARSEAVKLEEILNTKK